MAPVYSRQVIGTRPRPALRKKDKHGENCHFDCSLGDLPRERALTGVSAQAITLYRPIGEARRSAGAHMTRT